MKTIDYSAAACLCVLPSVGDGAESLPSEVRASINEARSDCKEKPVFKAGFLTKKDVNGDGIVDYMLDFGSFLCGGSTSIYCGSGGCLTTVFASLPGGKYAKVLDEKVRGVQFSKMRNRSAMTLELHGSACGKIGAEACRKVLYWNGRKFVKLR